MSSTFYGTLEIVGLLLLLLLLKTQSIVIQHSSRLLCKIVTEVRFPELLLLLWHHRDDVMRWVDDNIYTPLADII